MADNPFMPEIRQRTNDAMQMARRHGLDTSFASRVARSSTAFNAVYAGQKIDAGFGGLADSQVGNLDQELRLAAAASPMANAMGALHAMAESGVIDQGQLKQLMTPEAMAQGPAGIMGQLRNMGIRANVAGQFMGATKANQEMIVKHNLQDRVREMQRAEIGGIIQQDLEGNLIGSFRQQGMSRKEARAAAGQASTRMTKELMDIASKDPNMLNDTGKLLKRLEGAGVDRATAAGALQGLKDRVMSDPDLAKFGNLQGMLNMNSGAIEGGKAMLDKMGAEKPGEVQRGPAAKRGDGGKVEGAGTGNGMHITGTLTLNDKGQGQLEAQSNGAAPGG